MKWLIAALLAVVLGIAAGKLLVRLPKVRSRIGQLRGRGKLLAIVQQRGIYEADLEREASELDELIVSENLRHAAANERVEDAEIAREIELLRDEFASPNRWSSALARSDLSEGDLRARIAEQLRGLRWIESRIAPQVEVSEEESRAWFAAHPNELQLPARFHIAHIFLAAHAQTPPETTEAKSQAIQQIAERLKNGGDFAQLAGEFSEDEATKTRGGDLGFIAQSRVPPEIFAQIAAMRTGETSLPFQSHLGFHIFRVLEMKPERALTFEEVRHEITTALRNEKRVAACATLASQLNGAEFRAPR